MKKLLALLLALVLCVSVFAGCNDDKGADVSAEFGDVEFKFNEEADKVSDSSDLPDWTGKQLELTTWYAGGSYHASKNIKSGNDIVWPELQRVTGVRFSEESFDNNGDTQDARISKIIATGEWPDIIWGGQENITEQLIEQDMLWDLTDLIPVYMPHLHALMEKGDFLKSTRDDGRIYEIALYPKISYAYPDMDPEILSRMSAPNTNTTYVYVRDDILKKIKPEAFTQEEMLEKFTQNCSFTEEEILNASFSSKEEFFQFLRDVKALGLKNGNREVYPTYALSGSDNWDFLTFLAGSLNGFGGLGASPQNYFTYYDVETEKIEAMFKQDFYKEIMREMTQLIQEDIISQDSLIDNRATYEEKCYNGEYAVLYGGTTPVIKTLNDSVKANGYQYRKVIINIPFNESKFIPIENTIGGSHKHAFLKNEISAEDLPQVLRFYDFQLSEVGQKLQAWGPRSAGLFEELEDGSRRFTNKEVEDASLGKIGSEILDDYNLQSSSWPLYPLTVNKWHPQFIYEVTPSIDAMNRYISTGIINPHEKVQGTAPSIYSGFSTHIPEVETFWDARAAFESAMTKVLTAANDEEFETLYGELVALAERNGLTDETLEKMNDVWVNKINKDYMQNVYDFVKANKK